jgi:signal transduction histidine kinase
MERMHFLEKKVHKKIDDYHEYSFTDIQDAALRTFFDLSQEFESIEDLYRICVIIIKAFFNIDSMLYVGLNGSSMKLVCTPQDGLITTPDKTLVPPIMVTHEARESKGSYFIPIIGNKALVERLPSTCCGEILGILQLKDSANLSEKEKFFFQKFANRIGYALHNKVLMWKNINHLNFIRSLVKDIEHNIITPNIAFKLYIRRLGSAMKQCREIEKELGLILTATNINDHQKIAQISTVYDKIKDSTSALEEQVKNIRKHYSNTSLFLETLLRRAHFEKGHYVLNRKACNIKKDIIQPQLEEYKTKIKEKHIEIRDEYTALDNEKPMQVDIGLLSQVYANLFSNALKYTKEVKKNKYIAYGREVLKDYFFNGIHGIKYYVLSTGPHILAKERHIIFLEGRRGSNVDKILGTGQGLYFFKEIIRLHGGFVGYEAVPQGNKFYFILPISDEGVYNPIPSDDILHVSA